MRQVITCLIIGGLCIYLSSCSSRITKYVPGPKGEMGEQGIAGVAGNSGADGSNGFSTLMEAVPATTCPEGGTTLLLGLDVNRNAVLDVGEVTQSSTVCNGLTGEVGAVGDRGASGTNGADGHDAPPTAFTPVAILNPCGDAPGVYDEVFLKLSDGTVLASFSDNISGYNTRWSILVPGTYQTTDGDGCVFTLATGGVFTYENHHY